MKYRKHLLSIISLITCLALTGCDMPGFIYDTGYWLDDKVDDLGNWLNGNELEEFTYKDTEPYVPPVIDIEPEVSEEVIRIEDEAPKEEGDTVDYDDTALEQQLSADRYYAYGTLSQEERRIYRVIYTTMFDFGEKVPLPSLDADMIDKAFTCVLTDNPELFYVKGYNLIRYERGGRVEKMAISGLYTMTGDDSVVHQERAEAYVNTCLAGMPQTDDDYEKIKYLYEYIIKSTEYDLDAENGQNYLSVFENGRSVCQGYATAMQYLMIRSGLFCTLVRGITNSGENHAWNLVKSNGDYYYVDVTWGDMSYDLKADEEMAELPVMPEVSYEYLCVTTEDIRHTHTLETVFPLPDCVARYDNYYVRKGNYFTEINEDQLRSVFDEAYYNGEVSVTVKCANPYVYGDMKAFLTSDGKVFEFLHDKGNVNYVCLDNLNELIFYI